MIGGTYLTDENIEPLSVFFTSNMVKLLTIFFKGKNSSLAVEGTNTST